MCCGLKYQLLEHMFHATWLTVYVPAVALEELVANHLRASREERSRDRSARQARRRLRAEPLGAGQRPFDYRSYITERWDQRLAFNALPWPTVPHQELVGRAVSHLAAFQLQGKWVPGRPDLVGCSEAGC